MTAYCVCCDCDMLLGYDSPPSITCVQNGYSITVHAVVWHILLLSLQHCLATPMDCTWDYLKDNSVCILVFAAGHGIGAIRLFVDVDGTLPGQCKTCNCPSFGFLQKWSLGTLCGPVHCAEC